MWEHTVSFANSWFNNPLMRVLGGGVYDSRKRISGNDFQT